MKDYTNIEKEADSQADAIWDVAAHV